MAMLTATISEGANQKLTADCSKFA
jgi:hypothetical protein